MDNRRERTNRGLAQATIQEVLHQKPMFRTTFVTCSRTSQTDGYRRPRSTGCLRPKKSPKKPINRMCLGEESTDEPTQSGISISITESKVDRDGVSNDTRDRRVRGGDPSARSVRRNHFSRHHGYSDGKTANSSPSRSRSLTTSARRPSLHTTRGQPPGGWSNRENCKDWLQSHLQQHC